ncbi:MAG: hypothetical protein M5U22_22445 [Thermoleophilia bacterium]|nr:hypothetical protein [Thermoleophilia bacterium]
MKDLHKLAEIEDRLAEIRYTVREGGPGLTGSAAGARFVRDEVAGLLVEAEDWAGRWMGAVKAANAVLARLDQARLAGNPGSQCPPGCADGPDAAD